MNTNNFNKDRRQQSSGGAFNKHNNGEQNQFTRKNTFAFKNKFANRDDDTNGNNKRQNDSRFDSFDKQEGYQLRQQQGSKQGGKQGFNQNRLNKLNVIEENDNLTYESKLQLVEYIYKTIELSSYKYNLMEYEYDTMLLKDKKFYVSPNYNGIHSLLVFIKLKDKYFSVLIDRRTLNYNQHQLDIDKIKFIPITVRLDNSIYQGTIIDGVLLYNNTNGNKNFVVNDIYYFRGQNLNNDKISNKLLNINAFLESYLKTDDMTNNINFIVNKLYGLNEIQHLVNNYIPKSKYNNSIKGIAFYPETSGTKLIYLYNNCNVQTPKENGQTPKENDVKTIDNDSDGVSPKQKLFDVPIGEVSAVFRLKKTETVDVYQLFLGEKEFINGKNFIKYKKIDIAYIPTKECSFMCKELFDKSKNDTILMECKYLPDKAKWIPVKDASHKKYPDFTSSLQKMNT